MSKPFNNVREINIGGEQSKMPSEKKHSKGCLEGQVMYLIVCIQLCIPTYLYQHIETCLRNKSKLFRIHMYLIHSGQKCFIQVACLWSKMPIRRLMGSTDQADPSCIYFRISWILMDRPWIYFFCPLHLLQGLRSTNIKYVISTLLFNIKKS